MVVPGPRASDEREAAAGVAELFLQRGAGVGGNQVAGGGRIAVVEDARGAAFEERVVKMIELMVGIDQVFGRGGLQALLAQLGIFGFSDGIARRAFYGKSTTRGNGRGIERFEFLKRRHVLRQEDQPDEGEYGESRLNRHGF